MVKGRGMAWQPPAKRARMTPASVRDGDAGGDGEASSPTPRSSKLWPTFFVVLFAVRMSEMNPAPAGPSLLQIETMVQRIVDCAFNQFQELVSSKLEKAFQAFQGQIDNIHHEVRQMACLCSNRHADQHTRLEPNQEHAAANGSNTNIRLCFLNDLKPPIYTEKNITDKNNAAIKVAMFEGGKMITSGPLSKVKVEVLVLRGEFCNNGCDDWTEEEFDNHIVQGRDEQGLLGAVRLTKGEAELNQIRFKKGTCRKNVIMAARVCKRENIALRIKEAIMKPVVVLDRRNEANEKRYPPGLDDDVFRLEEIARNGPYRRRLRKEGICTVQHFLKAWNKDPNTLRKILQMETQNNHWSKLTGHARQCVLEDVPELKRYQSEEGNVVLFFNCVHDLVGAEFGCGYVASDNFSPDQKALVNKWKGRAYEILEDIASDYVIKGNVPEPISSSTDNAAGPSVPVVGTSQPIFSADHHHIASQDHGTALLQQPTTLDSNMPSWQQDLATLMNSDVSGHASIDGFQFPMPGEGACFCFTGALQSWCPEHGQGPSCSALPGPDHSNDCR